MKRTGGISVCPDRDVLSSAQANTLADTLAHMMKIFGDKRSGNCLKVKYTADYLGIRYSWHDVDIMKGESRTEEFLAMNPSGQVPVVVLDNGSRLAQSNAIILYLARGSTLLPKDPIARAKVDEWLFWEQYSHEPYIGVCRFLMLYLGKSIDEREPWRVARGEAALDFMNTTLASRDWLVDGGFSCADIGLFAYTQFAEEGGFSLDSRPHTQSWLQRSRAVLNPSG